jgi:hypothetical protein
MVGAKQALAVEIAWRDDPVKWRFAQFFLASRLEY